MPLICPRIYDVKLDTPDLPVFHFRPGTCREHMEVDQAYDEIDTAATARQIIEMILPLITRQLESTTPPIPGELIDYLEHTQLVELFVAMRCCEELSYLAKKNYASPSKSDGETSP